MKGLQLGDCRSEPEKLSRGKCEVQLVFLCLSRGESPREATGRLEDGEMRPVYGVVVSL